MPNQSATKPWWQSKTVWGGAVAIGAGVAGVFGYTVPEGAQQDLPEMLTNLAAAIGGAVAIFGRIVAKLGIR